MKDAHGDEFCPNCIYSFNGVLDETCDMHTIRALIKERDALRAALEQIRDQDYRGNRCSCSQLAFKVLNKKD